MRRLFRGKKDDSPRTPVTRQTLREAVQLLGYLWPYKGRFIGSMICLAVRWMSGSKPKK